MDKNVNVIDIADTVKVDEHIKSGGDVVSFMESIVLKNLEKGEKSFVSFFGHFIFTHHPVNHDENCKFTGCYSRQ